MVRRRSYPVKEGTCPKLSSGCPPCWRIIDRWKVDLRDHLSVTKCFGVIRNMWPDRRRQHRLPCGCLLNCKLQSTKKESIWFTVGHLVINKSVAAPRDALLGYFKSVNVMSGKTRNIDFLLNVFAVCPAARSPQREKTETKLKHGQYSSRNCQLLAYWLSALCFSLTLLQALLNSSGMLYRLELLKLFIEKRKEKKERKPTDTLELALTLATKSRSLLAASRWTFWKLLRAAEKSLSSRSLWIFRCR